MVRSIRADRTPHLLVMQYSESWAVVNMLLVPRVFFTESVIKKRKPLSLGARRSGWVGCNILLGQIPDDGKITVVSAGTEVPAGEVREGFLRVRTLSELPPSVRGWTVDVLRIVRRMAKQRFSLHELYDFELELRALHPQNRNIRPKIRQQLQILRDIGIIAFEGGGKYAVRMT